MKQKYLSIIFSAIILLLGMKATSARAADYYVSSSGNDSNSGTSEIAPWKTIEKVNNSTFQSGDNILFKRGDIWRERLVASSSGTEGNPIVFGAYAEGDKPIVSGADDITAKTWTEERTHIWSAEMPGVSVKLLIFNSDTLGKISQRGATTPVANDLRMWEITAPYEFWWHNGKLYIYSEGNPFSFYSKIEAGQRGNVIDSNNMDFVTFQDMILYGANDDYIDGKGGGGCVLVRGDSDNIIVRGNNISKSYAYGVVVRGATNAKIENNVITEIDSQSSQSSGDGITIRKKYGLSEPARYVEIRNNKVLGPFDRQGIAVTSGSDIIMDQNEVNGSVDLEPNSNDYITNFRVTNNLVNGWMGIGGGEESNIIENNLFEDNTINCGAVDFCTFFTWTDGDLFLKNNKLGRGIHRLGSSSEPFGRGGVYYVEGNTFDESGIITYGGKFKIEKNSFIMPSMQIGRGTAVSVSSAGAIGEINNNVVVGYYSGVDIGGSSSETNISIKNNIFQGIGYYVIYIRRVPVHVNVFNNIFLNNSSSIIFKGDTSIYSGNNNIVFPDPRYNIEFQGGGDFNWWKNKTSQDANSLTSDPLFLNSSGNFSSASDFKLQPTSPAIDAGADVGLTTDFEGTPVPQSSAPDIGAFEYKAATPTYSNADLNQDAKVDSVDLDILKTDFLKLTSNLGNPRSDINLDGQCTARDLGILMSGWLQM
jgi:hypothetical protein